MTPCPIDRTPGGRGEAIVSDGVHAPFQRRLCQNGAQRGSGRKPETEPGTSWGVTADVSLLGAGGGETWVRTRAARPLVDVRPLGELVDRFVPHGFVRIHRSYAVNLARIRSIRPRSGEGWEVKLDPPVNRVLPASESRAEDLWRAFGEG